MKYPYIVNYGGVWYPAGTEVPVEKPATDTPITKDENIGENTKNDFAYTSGDVFKMSKDKLIEIAGEYGIEDAENMKANELKKLINQKIKA